MRTLVLVLMVALLPLRLWAADGMSVRMATMPADCPMLAAAQSADPAAQHGHGDPTGHDASAEHGGGPDPAGCHSCQLPAAAVLPASLAAVTERPAVPVPADAAAFRSAAHPPDLRPPIA